MKYLIDTSYMFAAVLFIWTLKDLNSPRTAVRGNRIGAVGMLIAILATLLQKEIINFSLILAGLVVGSAIGAVLALKIRMTAMPQMVALLNGFGGAASALVASSEYLRNVPEIDSLLMGLIAASILIGWVTFTGSVIAFAKLEELMPGTPILYPFQHGGNLLVFMISLGITIYLVQFPSDSVTFFVLSILCCLLGVLLVIPIGGADMPVVISLLNSYSGLAASATGFVLSNFGLIISGALVGASGSILSLLMCRAMNRSLVNVLFGGFGKIDAQVLATTGTKKAIRECTVEEASLILDSASSIVVVPGYGLAVSQAQHRVREIADVLKRKGIQVRYGIHPVAGRMPGHMNVLLAEANVPYDELYEMDQINPYFPETDVVLVIGANDVVNPAAKRTKGSPIYGMPILEVEKAKVVIVCKRSLNPGFAGIDNELFYNDNTMMLFGDAKESMMRLSEELKNVR